MLEKIISKTRLIFKDAQQNLSAEAAAAVEQVYDDIIRLNSFIEKELAAMDNSSNLDNSSRKAARRWVFERAGRKLETMKAKKKLPKIRDYMKIESVDRPSEEVMALLQFFREKEVRDRLYLMTEAQILSLFGKSLFDGSNPLLINAILNAPVGFEPVSGETINKIARSSPTGQRTAQQEPGDEFMTTSNLDLMIGEIFDLAKKELDNLRRKELPTSLTQSKYSDDRPF